LKPFVASEKFTQPCSYMPQLVIFKKLYTDIVASYESEISSTQAVPANEQSSKQHLPEVYPPLDFPSGFPAFQHTQQHSHDLEIPLFFPDGKKNNCNLADWRHLYTLGAGQRGITMQGSSSQNVAGKGWPSFSHCSLASSKADADKSSQPQPPFTLLNDHRLKFITKLEIASFPQICHRILNILEIQNCLLHLAITWQNILGKQLTSCNVLRQSQIQKWRRQLLSIYSSSSCM